QLSPPGAFIICTSKRSMLVMPGTANRSGTCRASYHSSSSLAWPSAAFASTIIFARAMSHSSGCRSARRGAGPTSSIFSSIRRRSLEHPAYRLPWRVVSRQRGLGPPPQGLVEHRRRGALGPGDRASGGHDLVDPVQDLVGEPRLRGRDV